MKVKCYNFEWFLIIGALTLSFFYFVFRSIVFNNVIWIMVMPALCGSYIALKSHRFSSYKHNGLDKAIRIYLLYGVIMTMLGLYISSKTIAIEVFVHYYMPAITYFISRRYSSYSKETCFKVIHVTWLIAVILIIDVLIEGMLYRYSLSVLVPWAHLGEENVVKYSDAWFGLGYRRVGSILTSSKTTEMVLASLFCFLFPFSMNWEAFENNQQRTFFNEWGHTKATNSVILALILICSIGILRLTNKTALLSIMVVVMFYILRTLSRNGVFLTLGLATVVFLMFQDFLAEVYVVNFKTVHYKWGHYAGVTVPQYLFDLSVVVEGYKGNYLFDYIIGKYLASGIPSSYPFAFFTELRLLSTPLYFGILWTAITMTIVFIVATYCFQLMNTRKNHYLSYLGVSFFGFYLIYAFDIHYPVFFRHGPIELLFILTGALSSIRSCFLDRELSSKQMQ